MQIKQFIPKLSTEGLIRVAVLTVVAFVLACALNQRLGSNWGNPIEYGIDGPAADVKGLLAGFKAASEGHYIPFLSKRIPQLGAPYVANWDDYPCTEQMHILAGGILTKMFGLFPAINLMAILSHVVSALGFYLACRLLNYRWEWSASRPLSG